MKPIIFYVPLNDDNLGGSKLIPLSQGKFAIVDEDNFDALSEHNWMYSHGYAKRNFVKENGKKTTIYLHRVILGAEKGQIVDHKNGNPLDNRKTNIRICSQSENLFNKRIQSNNKSGYKGVAWNKEKKKWQAQARFCGKRYSIGYFQTKEEAAKAYNNTIIKISSEFSKPNEL